MYIHDIAKLLHVMWMTTQMLIVDVELRMQTKAVCQGSDSTNLISNK